MKNRKKWGVYLMGVVLAVHTAGCGSTEPPAGNRSEPPVSDEAEQNGVGNQEDNMSAEDRAQTETADTDGSNILIAYFTAGENSDVDVVSSASVTTVDGEAKGRLRAVADMIQTQTGGTLFSIQTSVDYPGDGGALMKTYFNPPSEMGRME